MSQQKIGTTNVSRTFDKEAVPPPQSSLALRGAEIEALAEMTELASRTYDASDAVQLGVSKPDVDAINPRRQACRSSSPRVLELSARAFAHLCGIVCITIEMRESLFARELSLREEAVIALSDKRHFVGGAGYKSVRRIQTGPERSCARHVRADFSSRRPKDSRRSRVRGPRAGGPVPQRDGTLALCLSLSSRWGAPAPSTRPGDGRR